MKVLQKLAKRQLVTQGNVSGPLGTLENPRHFHALHFVRYTKMWSYTSEVRFFTMIACFDTTSSIIVGNLF